MAATPKADFTQLLSRLDRNRTDDNPIIDQIFNMVYNELRILAHHLMHRERADHTLQPTALVHEAYCRLVDETRIEWKSRTHFFGIAARAMRQILVNYANRRSSVKRGGGLRKVTLHEDLDMGKTPIVDIVELDEALNKLAEIDKRPAQVVELHIFGGLGFEEIAHFLHCSRRTVFKDWRVAKMMLKRMLTEESDSKSMDE